VDSLDGVSITINQIPYEWTVLDLKAHLAKTHPQNPTVKSMKLIYAGKMLSDEKETLELFWVQVKKTHGSAIIFLIDKEIKKRELLKTANTQKKAKEDRQRERRTQREKRGMLESREQRKERIWGRFEGEKEDKQKLELAYLEKYRSLTEMY
jgi:hypothetical protein